MAEKKNLEQTQLVSSINWVGSKVEAAITSEDKETLTDQVKLLYIKGLIDENESILTKHKAVYEKYNDTDLGSIITRIEQNVIQLRKMQYGLTE